MYIHGFRSGANGSKKEQLQKHFEGRFRVIAPEVDADPDKSLATINEIIAKEAPAIIVGTSLGGWMTLMCESGDAQLVVVNPALDPRHTLSQWAGEELSFFCPRLDGVQTYTLTQKVLQKYAKYDVLEAIRSKAARITALCSSADELLGSSHVDTLWPLIRHSQIIETDDFGHRCEGSGITHLFKIIDNIATAQAWSADASMQEAKIYIDRLISKIDKLQETYDTIIMILSTYTYKKTFMINLYDSIHGENKIFDCFWKRTFDHDELEQFIRYDKLEEDFGENHRKAEIKLEKYLYDLNDTDKEFEANKIGKRYLRYFNFLVKNDKADYVEMITDKNVLVLDDIYSSVDAISDAVEAIKQNYMPKSVTIVTLSSLLNYDN